MAITKPRGDQLDIASVATELTTDAGALAVLDAEYTRVDNTNGNGFVDLTSAQDIGGTKTFTDVPIMERASGNTQMFFKTTGVNENNIIFQRDGVGESAIYSLSSSTLFRRFATGTDSEFRIFESSFTFNKDVTINADLTINGTTTTVDTANLAITDNIITVNDGEAGTGVTLGAAGIEIDRGLATNQQLVFDEATDKWQVGEIGSLLDLATESYVDAADALKFDKTGGTLTGDLFINNATGQPVLSVDALDGISDPIVVLRQSGVNVGSVFSTGDNTTLYHYTAGTDTRLDLYDNYGVLNKPMRASTPVATNDLTTKDYVDTADALKFDKTGGTISGVVTISDPTLATLIVNSTTDANVARVRLQNAGVTVGEMFAINSASLPYIRMQKYKVGGGVNNISVYDDYIQAASVIRASTPVDTTDLTTKAYVDDNFVADAGGTMTGQLTVSYVTPTVNISATDTSSPQVRLSNSGGLQTQLYYVNGSDEFVALNTGGASLAIGSNYLTASHVLRGVTPVATNDLTTKDYVDTADALKLNLTGGTITGAVTISPATGQGTFNINSVDNVPAAFWQINGVEKGAAYATDTYFRIRKDNGANDTLIDMYNDFVSFNKPVIGVAPTSTSHLTRKDYVDDNFVSLTAAENIGGNKIFINDVQISKTSAAMIINAATGSHSQLVFRENAVNKGFIYHDFANDIFRIQRRNGATTTNEIQIRDTYVNVTDDLRITNMGTATTSVTTKAYVDDNFIHNNNGTQTINSDLFLQPATGNSTLRLYGAAGSGGLVRFYSGTTDIAWINTSSSVMVHRHFHSAAGANTELALYDDYINVNKVVRGITPVGTTDLTTKAYVDDNFVDLTTAQTVGGLKTFSSNMNVSGDFVVGDGTTNANPIITIDSTAGGNPQIWFERVGVDVGKIVGNSGSLVISRGTTSLTMGTTTAVFSTVVRGETPVNTTDLTTKAYVDDRVTTPSTTEGSGVRMKEGTNNGTMATVIQGADNITSSYIIKMPAAPGTAGQRLEIASVSGINLIMAWVTP